MDVIKLISKHFNINLNKNVIFVKDRPFNDKIYKINCEKIKKLGGTKKKNSSQNT